MKTIILPIFLFGLLTVALADYQCTAESYAAYREEFGKNEQLSPE